MISVRSVSDVVDVRRSVLHTLNHTVTDALLAAASIWHLDGEAGVSLTVYDRLYERSPRIGGHWTLFRATLSPTAHEVATITVSLEFDSDCPVDFRVSGAVEVVAGGCTAAALAEALAQCDGPLRQVTLLGRQATPAAGPVSALRMGEMIVPALSLNERPRATLWRGYPTPANRASPLPGAIW